MKKHNVVYYFLGIVIFSFVLLFSKAISSTKIESPAATVTPVVQEIDCQRWVETGTKMQSWKSEAFSITVENGDKYDSVEKNGSHQVVYPVLRCAEMSPTN